MHYVIRKCNIENCFVYLIVPAIVLLSCSANAVFSADNGEIADFFARFAGGVSHKKAIHDYAD